MRNLRARPIARSSGTEQKDVKELLKYYETTRSMMKGLSSNRKMQRQLKFQK